MAINLIEHVQIKKNKNFSLAGTKNFVLLKNIEVCVVTAIKEANNLK